MTVAWRGRARTHIAVPAARLPLRQRPAGERPRADGAAARRRLHATPCTPRATAQAEVNFAQARACACTPCAGAGFLTCTHGESRGIHPCGRESRRKACST